MEFSIDSGVVALIIIVVAILSIVSGGFFLIHTKEVGIIERLGKYNRTAHAGLNFKIPFIETVRTKMNLQVRQLNVEVETKTKDNVFVVIPVAVQYQVVEGREQEAFYSLESPEKQLVSYVQDNVRTSLATMDLDTAFESKDNIAQNIENTLSEKMSNYGYRIITTLVTDIRPGDKVREAMDNINAAQRERDAAISLAEANKIKLVKEAEGEAEAKRLQGVGIAQEREAIVNGLAEQLKTLREAGVDNQPEQLLIMTQYFDTLIGVSKNGKSNVLMVPSNPGGLNTMADEIRNALLSTEKLDLDKQ